MTRAGVRYPHLGRYNTDRALTTKHQNSVLLRNSVAPRPAIARHIVYPLNVKHSNDAHERSHESAMQHGRHHARHRGHYHVVSAGGFAPGGRLQ